MLLKTIPHILCQRKAPSCPNIVIVELTGMTGFRMLDCGLDRNQFVTRWE